MTASVKKVYGQKAAELLFELKRTEEIPAFNHAYMLDAVNEINQHHHTACEILTQYPNEEERQRPEIAGGLLVHHVAALRGKRMLLAYVNERARRLRAMRQENGPTLADDVKDKLCKEEVEFFQQYHSLLSSYEAQLPVELTGSTDPPKALFVEVRVLKDLGQIVTDNGLLELEKDTTHYLRRSDAETFLRSGFMELIG